MVDAAIVVQARMGSARLPGKVLLPFGGSTLLGHILRRLAGSGLDLWVATTTRPEDDGVVAVASAAGARAFRGPEDDVLGRFVGCVDAMPQRPELIVRMCADRPFACSVLVEELLDLYDDAGRPDYLSNSLVPSYPVGLDVELVRTESLVVSAAESVDPYEREHVTPYLYRTPERFSAVNVACPFGNFASIRAVIDTAADHHALAALADELPLDHDYRAVLSVAALAPNRFPT